MYVIQTTFLDGKTKYFSGEVVSAENFDKAQLDPTNTSSYVNYGWISPLGITSQDAQVNANAAALEIHSLKHGRMQGVV